MVTCRKCKYSTEKYSIDNADYIECSCPAPWACWDNHKDPVPADEKHNCPCWAERSDTQAALPQGG